MSAQSEENKKDSSFFSKVSTRSERERAFRMAIERKSELQCKSDNGQFFFFLPEYLKNNVMFTRPTKKTAVYEPVDCVVSFMAGQERFFFRTRFVPGRGVNTEGLVEMLLPSEVYKLQRRDLYRLVIPEGSGMSADFFRKTPLPARRFRLHDLSGGGFCVELELHQDCDFGRNQEVVGEIRLSSLIKKEVQAKVAYVQSFGSMGSGLVRVGFQFLGLTTPEREAIVQSVWDLHRDLYALIKKT